MYRYAGYDPSRTIVVSDRHDPGWSTDLVLLTRDAEGALTLVVVNTGRPVQMQIGEDVEEYRRLYTVAATDIPRMVDAWLQDTGEVATIEKDNLAFSVARRIIGDLAPNDEGSTIIGRFIAWLEAHAIPYQSKEQLLR
jgi:hypothetical protein